MRTLKNHIILFDAECPMCKLYTQAFVKTQMLDANGRASYQQIPEVACPYIDRQRAANEIALLNTETGEVNYGITSLFKVLGHAFPVFKPLFAFVPFQWFMSKVYAFISYNRRVIVPANQQQEKVAYQPQFQLHYRLVYLAFTWIFTGFILSNYGQMLNAYIPGASWSREYLICGGQIFFQGAVVFFLNREKLWQYLGNMMTISFAGALLLTPLLVLHHFFSIPAIISVIYFLAVAGLMLLEHIRRLKLIEANHFLSISWVTYRILILLLIL